MAKSFDVVVIGAGPAGYVAAIRCAQLGLHTACVDRWDDGQGNQTLGGTCLNVGCIPSKALLDSSEQYHKLQHQFAAHGIRVAGASIDIAAMLERKNKIVRNLTDGIRTLFEANKVSPIFGHGRLAAGNTVEILDGPNGAVVDRVSARSVILASGSEPTPLPPVPFDGARIVDSAGALTLAEVPRRLGVIGAGVIGLELGSVWRRLGSEVVLLEALDTFLDGADQQVAKEARRQFKRQGLDIRLGSRVEAAETTDQQVRVRYTDGGGEQTLDVDCLIVAIGRRPCTDNLVSADVTIKRDERGAIDIDEHYRTNVEDVYAIGDVVRGPMLAHKGSEEGVAVAELIAGKPGHVNYESIPWVIYTAPEIAWVGASEQALAASGIAVNTGTFPFAATGRARAMEEAMGFVKIIAEAATDRVRGVHIIGPHASELIAEAVLAIEYQASSEDLARTVHAHPTLSEALHEAALAVDRRAIHKAN